VSIVPVPKYVYSQSKSVVTKSDMNNEIEQLKERIKRLDRENENLSKQVSKLEEENKELKKLLLEQDAILTALAKTKRFTQKIWSTFITEIEILNKKVNERMKELEKEKK
jgi:cell division protein FtsB